MTQSDTITVRFPEDTCVPLGALVKDTDFTIAASPGWFGTNWLAANVTGVTAAGLQLIKPRLANMAATINKLIPIRTILFIAPITSFLDYLFRRNF